MSNEMRYYSFYNSEPNKPIQIELRTVESGWLSYYVSRGKNSRPSATKNLSFAYSGVYGGKMKLTPELLKNRKYKDARGHYVIGIVQNSFSANDTVKVPTKYTLKVITNPDDLVYASLGN